MTREEIEKKAEEIAESFRTARSFSRHPSDIAYNAAIQMAEWQKQQMMKDVVEGLVGGHTDIPAFINLEIEHKPNVKVGDKVKIVILKTE